MENKKIKVGTKIQFNMQSDDIELTDFLYENNLFGCLLEIVSVDNNSKLFWIDGCDYAISFNDNFIIK